MIDRLKIIVAVVFLFFDFSNLSAQVANTDNDTELNFLEYCKSSELNTENSHTLVSLKKRYKINSCDKLFEKLNKLEFISLRGKEIKNISIFKYFVNLKRLGLDDNKIDDLSVFEGFDDITYLSLRNNDIIDVRPLLRMNSLKQVYLDGNPIEKESKLCPITTLIDSVNQFCFDEKRFDSDFKKEKIKSNVTKEEVRKIIEKIVNFPGVEIYYHVNVAAERSPLQVYFNFDMSSKELNLQKFNKKVLVVKKPNKLALKIKILIHGELAIVKFIYPPEGVRGNFKMKKSNGDWNIFKSHIYE